MRDQEEFLFYQLPNGMRLVHKNVDSPVAHAGVIVGAGSRDEEPDEQGIAHFIEHCVFKGTAKRKAFHVLSRLEDVGGDLNAYTAREETFVYASFLKDFYARSLELFSDILFHSSFPEKELEKEKLVILDEINSFKDDPYEMIYDQFEELVFRKHPLGRNILGTEKSVRSFRPENLRRFCNRLYSPEKMVLCSVGNIPWKELVKATERYFGHYQGNTTPGVDGQQPLVFSPSLYKPFTKSLNKHIFQTHCVTGGLAFGYKDPRRLTFNFLINLLGGPAMSSRLNMTIREKYGHAYQVEATYTPFRETGVFSVYLGTENNNLERSLALVEKELKKVREMKIGPAQFRKARQQFIGQLAISLESNVNQMISIGKSYQVFDKVDTFNEIVKKVENITVMDLMEVANEIFVPDQMSTLIYRSK
ncbi:MAG: pitrilysin family protein [Bacteroidetes bacterium]|nr:pitrilysin family protein [Bacteroidota bacterium]